jgi:DNA-binding XRE family transcriptional regulator
MKPQIIKTKAGDLVVLARTDYEVLRRRAREIGHEDAGTARILKRSDAALAAGRDVMLPAAVAEAIARGESALRAVREWRGMTQAQLGSEATSVGQGTVSALETGRRQGTPAHWRQLARALRVPLNLLMAERSPAASLTAALSRRR